MQFLFSLTAGLGAYALEKHFNFMASLGPDHRRGRTRLGQFYNHFGSPQVYERRFAFHRDRSM